MRDVVPQFFGFEADDLAGDLATAGVAVLWLTRDGRVSGANGALLSLLGYTAEEFIGWPLHGFLLDAAVVDDIWLRLGWGRNVSDYETRLKAKDDAVRDVSMVIDSISRGDDLVYARCFVHDLTERHRVESELRARIEALEASVERYDAVLRQMPSAVAVVEAPSTRVLLANEKNGEFFRQPDVPIAELWSPRRFRLAHLDDRPAESNSWPLWRAIHSGEVVQGEELAIVRGDGTEGYIRVNAAPIRDRDEQIVAGIVTYDDVTEAKKAQLALKEQCRINDLLLRVGTALTLELDLDKLLQRLTDKAMALCGAQFGAFFYRHGEGQDERFELAAISGASRSAIASTTMPRGAGIFAPVFSGTGVIRIDDVTADPRYAQHASHEQMPESHLPVRSCLAVPVKARTGERLGALLFGHSAPGVFRESDERLLASVASAAAVAIDNARLYQAAKRAEVSAERERARLYDLLVQAPAIIGLQRGADHVCEFVNPAAQRLLRGRVAIGKPVREVLPELSPFANDVLDRVYRLGERYTGTEVPIVFDWEGCGRVEEKFFNCVCAPSVGFEGEIEGVMFFGFEVTDQVVARRTLESVVKELEVASRTKDEFLATVSHELRTPLNAILGWVRMLRSGTLPEDRRERALETIERNANAQTQLIEDLLDVSRIISGKLRLEIGSVDLPHVVEGAVEAVKPAADARGVTIRQTMDPQAYPILGDADRLQQIIWNLLSNAVKFTPRGGRIQVAVRKMESSVEIIVHDNGQGIDPAFLPYVFERFRQADGTTTRAHGGLGLGLAIVRHLVELHGGTVAVESEGLGKGATFTVTLPMSPLRSTSIDRLPALPLVSPIPKMHCPPELEGIRVLVVDDEPDARDLLVSVLSPCKAHVTTAGSVAEAFQLVQDIRPDVIVSDIGMPGEDGYVLIRKIRALPVSEGGRTPAVALTAYARIEDRTKALVAGFNMHVPKPVEPAELLVVLVSLTTLFPHA